MPNSPTFRAGARRPKRWCDKTPTTREKFLRYTRSELLSYLTPVILVDGQHRLLGALESLRLSLDTFESTGSLPIDDPLTEKMLHLIEQGMQHQDVRGSLEAELVRFLPVSLLLSKEPQEHVFQFIVVNQKAKPIPPALLATITSTTLTDDELESVADRLRTCWDRRSSTRALSLESLPTRITHSTEE